MRVRDTHRFSPIITLVTAVMAVCVGSFIAAKPAQAFSGDGAGTAESPYKITTCAELLDISSDLAAHYELASYVDCDGITFHPIGDSTTPFTGMLDGKGFGIQNVVITETADDVGIFGALDTVTITDLRLKNISVSGQQNVGALAGTTYQATLTYIGGTNITVTASGQNAGGLVGQLGGSSIAKSFVENVDLTGAGAKNGGLVGWAVGPTTVDDSYAIGDITATTTVGGVIGMLGAGPALANHLYADMTFHAGGSGVIGSIGSGGSTSSTFMANSSYLSNHTQSPLDTWDFNSIWYVRPGNYPGLRPHTLPILLCYAPSSTNTSITASCTSEPLLEGDPHWELRYGFDDDTARTALTTQAGQSFSVTVPNVLPGTDYDIEFRYVDAVGTSLWGKVVVITTGSSDVDNDNLSNEEEFKAPNNGDANNDGVKDYTQANVTSFLSAISGKYVTLKTACTDNFNTQLGLESSSQKDADFDYPAGLLGFVIRGCSPGATTPVEIYFYGDYDSAAYLARKVDSGVYTTLPNASFSTATIGGQPALKLAYTLTDGGPFDSDHIADGNIVDPVGIAPKPAVAAVGVPNTGVAPGNLAFTFIAVGSGIALIGASLRTRRLVKSPVAPRI